MAELSRVPLLYQPGEAWLYDTCSALQGVLIARPAFPLASGGLVATVDDWLAFGRMLLSPGGSGQPHPTRVDASLLAVRGQRPLTPAGPDSR